ncbi:MAG: hypothetical protein FWF77_06600 [Defluviitaleaceae bacterium]|nr:hypothetical protein [Defluviitaleaceae bacterium]
MKYYDEGKTIRLIWSWPTGIETVQIHENDEPGRLYTLQEYKQRGGYILPKKPGRFTCYIGENSETDENRITFTHKTEINISVREKFLFPWQKFKNFEIIFSSEHNVPEDIIHYEISSRTTPFSEPLAANTPEIRIITANSPPNFFIPEENSELYKII